MTCRTASRPKRALAERRVDPFALIGRVTVAERALRAQRLHRAIDTGQALHIVARKDGAILSAALAGHELPVVETWIEAPARERRSPIAAALAGLAAAIRQHWRWWRSVARVRP